MEKVHTLEQFKQLQNLAVRQHKFKHNNFIMSDDEIAGHIGAGMVLFEQNDKVLIVLLHLHGADWLYYWLSNGNSAYIPAIAKNPLLVYFGHKNRENLFCDVADLLKFEYKTTVSRYSAKVDEMELPTFPSFVRNNFSITTKQNFSYEYYINLISPYFDMNTDVISTKYLWDICSQGLTLIEVTTADGTIVGFLTVNSKGKKVITHHGAVLPKYRGLGILPLMFERILDGYSLCETWIHDWNHESIKLQTSLGLTTTGDYRKFYTKRGI